MRESKIYSWNHEIDPSNGLDVREHKESGMFVRGLTKVKVVSLWEIDKIMEKGIRNRTI